MHRGGRLADRLHDMWKGPTKANWEFPPKPSRIYWRVKQQYDELLGRWIAGMMGRFGM